MLKRNIKVLFRLNQSEHAALKNNVEKSGMSQEAYIRFVLSERIPKETPPVDYYQMTKKLYAIGNQLNQIAVCANSTGVFMVDRYAACVDELQKQIMQIRAAIELPERRENEQQ